MIGTKRNLAIEKQRYSHIGLTKQQRSSQIGDEFSFFVPLTFNSLGSPSFTREVITIDDSDEEETLDPKKKKPRLGSWWDDGDKEETLDPKKKMPRLGSWWDDGDKEETLDPKKKKPRLGSWWDVDEFNELNIVVKGLPKRKDAAASIVDSSLSSTILHETMTKNKEEGERSLSSRFHENFPDSCDYKGYSDGIITSNNQENQESVGYGQVPLEEPVDSCFSSCFTDLPKTGTNTNKDDERSLVSSSHHDDNFIDLSKEKIVGESTNRGNQHVSLEEFGVSVEDLKSMPWEAFDPTWEIRSETMDPWLGGYTKDMLSTHY